MRVRPGCGSKLQEGVEMITLHQRAECPIHFWQLVIEPSVIALPPDMWELACGCRVQKEFTPLTGPGTVDSDGTFHQLTSKDLDELYEATRKEAEGIKKL
jgi:hypothetical protein